MKEKYPSQVEVVNGDLADFSLAQKAVDTAVSTFGRLDGMVLNHGVLGQVGKIDAASTDEWKAGFDVNFISLVAFVRLFLNSPRISNCLAAWRACQCIYTLAWTGRFRSDQTQEPYPSQ